MIYFYRVIFTIIKCIVLILKPFAGAKLNLWIGLRGRSTELIRQKEKSFWFHASSGEIEYVKSVIIALKNENPSALIYVTYSSPSAEKLFSNIKPYVTQFLPLPWDKPAPIQNLLKVLNPGAIIFSRTDFWPELIYQANNLNVPIYIVSYFGRLSKFRKLMARWLFSKVKYISCVDELSAAQLKSVLPGTVQISVDGDTRFDQVFWRLGQSTKVHLKTSQPVFICGSTWLQDEEKLFLIFDGLFAKNYKIILSPHEVNSPNISRLATTIKKMGRSLQILSEQNKSNIELTADFLLIDEIGFLADFYRYSQIAFVGGSFKEKVHSVMEPLCCGLPVLLGPHFSNNPEAKKYAQHKNPQAIYICQNSDELLSAIEQIEETGLLNLQTQIQSLMRLNLNATKKITIQLRNSFLKN